jgi:HAD superfamily hydrolase (TIGR01509 family)
MHVDLVIFDKDGTLIDVHYYWGGMVELRAKMLSKNYVKPLQQEKATCELMSNMGIDLYTRKIKSTGPVGIKPREFIIDTAYQTTKRYFNAITLEQVSSVFEEIDVYSQTHLVQLVKPLPGVEALLTELKQQKIQIAIATTDLTNRAKLAMDSIGLSHYFDDIAGADLVDNAKPSPDLVNYLCDKMSVDVKKTVVIGDSIVDLEMAEAAAVGFVGVKTGLHSPEFLERSQVLVDDLTQIGRLL